MLRILDHTRPFHRRTLLTATGVGAAHCLLGNLLAGETPKPALREKSVIYLFQQGGPSQLETFDPKPEAPSNTRTVTDTVATTIPSVRFGAHLQQLARLADRLTVIRSFQTGNAGHNLQPLVGDDSLEANIGVHFARVAGATRPATGTPTNAVLYPASVDENVPRPQARGNLLSTGPYGKAFAPFVPGAGGQFQADLKLNIERDRLLNDRQGLLAALDRLKRNVDAEGRIAALDELQQQAYRVLLGGGVTRALDLALEDETTLRRYDTAPLVQKGRWNSVRRGKAGYYDANASCLGKLLLLARRLCEAGCGFVTVHAGYAGVWDMHADGNNLSMSDGMQAIGPAFDHAVSAFVEDLEARGLSDKILLVCGGEMGRTPRINKRGGRDHWARLAPLLLYGGGQEPGVLGQSDRLGGEPLSNPLGPKHLISTLLNTLINAGELRLDPSAPAQVSNLLAHPPLA